MEQFLAERIMDSVYGLVVLCLVAGVVCVYMSAVAPTRKIASKPWSGLTQLIGTLFMIAGAYLCYWSSSALGFDIMSSLLSAAIEAIVVAFVLVIVLMKYSYKVDNSLLLE